MFFAKPGEYEPCQMYSTGHMILLTITLIVVMMLIQFTKNSDKNRVKKIIKNTTILLWTMEIIKIIFNLAIGHWNNPNHYIPLYYCSIILYAGLFSSYGENLFKKIGDIFISTGAIIGGAFFLSTPNTSLTMYPMFHYISIQSFVFHGAMVYLGILVNITGYVDLKLKDIRYYAVLITIMSGISYVVNNILDTNFMFISQNFPNTPVEAIFNWAGKYFTIVMCLLQIILPFLIIYTINKLIHICIATIKKYSKLDDIESPDCIEENSSEEELEKVEV